MPYDVASFEPTPNPNAVKCLVSPAPTRSPRSYFSASEAAGDPLAEALFAVPGVTNVLIHVEFISICKRPDARWPPIRRAVEQVLRDTTH